MTDLTNLTDEADRTNLAEPESRSMATSDVKRLVGVAAIATAGLVVAALVAGFALIIYQTGTGANPADAFNEIPQVPEAFEDLVTWRADPELDRAMEPTTRRSIEAAWVRSWARMDIARRTGSIEGLETWFQGALLDQGIHAVQTGPPSAITQKFHELAVEFYSLDGSVVGLRAVSDLARAVPGGEPFRSVDTYEVVFLLSDGNWRIQSLVRAATAVPELSPEESPEILASRDTSNPEAELRWAIRR